MLKDSQLVNVYNKQKKLSFTIRENFKNKNNLEVKLSKSH